jgi:lysozyme
MSGLKQRNAIAATLGTGAMIAAAMALAVPEIRRWEGKGTITYLDIARVPTACYGHTGPDAGPLGRRWTDAQCEALLDRDVQAHLQPILRCVPAMASRPGQLAAATILAFNIGTAAFCRSTVARRWNAGDWRGGCEAFLMWVHAGGRVVPGLINRRKAERAICLRGL